MLYQLSGVAFVPMIAAGIWCLIEERRLVLYVRRHYPKHDPWASAFYSPTAPLVKIARWSWFRMWQDEELSRDERVRAYARRIRWASGLFIAFFILGMAYSFVPRYR